MQAVTGDRSFSNEIEIVSHNGHLYRAGVLDDQLFLAHDAGVADHKQRICITSA